MASRCSVAVLVAAESSGFSATPTSMRTKTMSGAFSEWRRTGCSASRGPPVAEACVLRQTSGVQPMRQTVQLSCDAPRLRVVGGTRRTTLFAGMLVAAGLIAGLALHLVHTQ